MQTKKVILTVLSQKSVLLWFTFVSCSCRYFTVLKNYKTLVHDESCPKQESWRVGWWGESCGAEDLKTTFYGSQGGLSSSSSALVPWPHGAFVVGMCQEFPWEICVLQKLSAMQIKCNNNWRRQVYFKGAVMIWTKVWCRHGHRLPGLFYSFEESVGGLCVLGVFTAIA